MLQIFRLTMFEGSHSDQLLNNIATDEDQCFSTNQLESMLTNVRTAVSPST